MKTLHDLIASSDLETIRAHLATWTPPTIANAIRSLSPTDQAVVIRVLPRQQAAAPFEFLDRHNQEELLKATGEADVAAILNHMAPDDRTGLLEECPAEVTKSLLALLTPEQRQQALALLGYPRGSVGRLMTPHCVAIKAEWTVQAVLDHVRAVGKNSETLSMLYVVGERGELIDDINIREFLLAPPTTFVSQLMDYRFVGMIARRLGFASQVEGLAFISSPMKPLHSLRRTNHPVRDPVHGFEPPIAKVPSHRPAISKGTNAIIFANPLRDRVSRSIPLRPQIAPLLHANKKKVEMVPFRKKSAMLELVQIEGPPKVLF